MQRQPAGGTPETLQSLLYTYDTAGNLRKSEDLLVPKQLEQDFGYDALHRLSHVVASGSLGYGLHSYAYDDAGNLTEKGPLNALGQPGPGRLQLHYGRTAAQPTSVVRVDRHDGTSFAPGHAFYAYHEDGSASWRQVAGQQLWLERALDGTLEQVTFSGQDRDAFYADDPEGLRAEKLVASGPWWSVIEESRLTVDASFEVDTLNDRHEVHLFVGGRRVATSRRSGLGNGVPGGGTESVTSYHPDQVGTNVLTVTSTPSGQTLSRAALEPFGQKLASSGTAPRYLFTDQERDAETGLDDFGARTYDPLVGRFLEQDPELLGDARMHSTHSPEARNGKVEQFDSRAWNVGRWSSDSHLSSLVTEASARATGGGITFSRIPSDPAHANGYVYALNRPTLYVDRDGRIVGAAAGALIGGVGGFVTGFSMELGRTIGAGIFSPAGEEPAEQGRSPLGAGVAAGIRGAIGGAIIGGLATGDVVTPTALLAIPVGYLTGLWVGVAAGAIEARTNVTVQDCSGSCSAPGATGEASQGTPLPGGEAAAEPGGESPTTGEASGVDELEVPEAPEIF